MKKENVIDEIDKKIIQHLLRDARTSVLEISRQEGLSGAAIHKRLDKLDKLGVIKGSGVFLDMEVLGYSTLCFVGIFLEKASMKENVKKELLKVPEILECHHTSGRWNLFVKVISKNNSDFASILTEKIQTIEGVKGTESLILFSQSTDNLHLNHESFEKFEI